MGFQASEQFCSLFPDVRFPIIQAPMAGTATPELAAAVSNAGGLGSIGIGSSNPASAREMILATQALTDLPFNVNVFCHQPPQRDSKVEQDWITHLGPLFEEFDAKPPIELTENNKSFLADDDVLEILLETKPPVVSFHFGLPHPHQLAALKNAGITTLATATDLADARLIESAGVDAIVAQGIEAGGHRGVFSLDETDEKLPTSVLVRLLVSQLDIPVIASGGIMDGKGIRAMLDIGAVAAQMGTAFVLCPESAANSGYRDALKSEKSAATRLTRTISGRPARGLNNRLIEYCESPESPKPPAYPVTYDAGKQLIAAAAGHGNFEIAAHWAGQGAPLAREMPAADLVETLMSELEG